jgi:hypothetical protein
MSAYLWLSKLNVQPDALCRCGHAANVHSHGKDCTAIINHDKMLYCKCSEFHEAKIKIEGENEVTKEKKVRKPKGEGRTPSLAPYAAQYPFKIWMTYDGKEREATVLTSGVIRYKEKDYNSPSSAATAVLKEFGAKGLRDGWTSWKFNKDDKRVPLNVLRGSKSPLKLEAPKPKSEKKTKAAKPNGSAKPKRSSPRKRRADREATLAPATQQAQAEAVA